MTQRSRTTARVTQHRVLAAMSIRVMRWAGMGDGAVRVDGAIGMARVRGASSAGGPAAFLRSHRAQRLQEETRRGPCASGTGLSSIPLEVTRSRRHDPDAALGAERGVRHFARWSRQRGRDFPPRQPCSSAEAQEENWDEGPHVRASRARRWRCGIRRSVIARPRGWRSAVLRGRAARRSRPGGGRKQSGLSRRRRTDSRGGGRRDGRAAAEQMRRIEDSFPDSRLRGVGLRRSPKRIGSATP